MLEILKWIHESFWHYLSICSMLLFFALWSLAIAHQLSKIGRPRKHVKHSIKDTQNL